MSARRHGESQTRDFAAAPVPADSLLSKRDFLRSAVFLLAVGAPKMVTAQARRVIRYGGDAAFAPFESLDAQGRPQGFEMDLLAALSEVLGVDFQIALQPWEKTEAEFKRGAFDVIALVDTAERRQWALFTHGHATPALAIYHRQEQGEPQGLQDLSGRRIALLNTEATRDMMAKWLTGITGPFVRVANAGEALLAVQEGRADVALLPRAYADPLLAAGNVPDVRASRLSLGLQTYAFAVAPGQDALRSELQRGLDELERTGKLEILRTKWLSSHREFAVRGKLERGLTLQREWTWGIGGVSAVALGWMGVGLWRRGRRIAAEKQRRREAELALQQAEALLERTFAHNPEPMLIVESDSGLVRDGNAAVLALLGVKADGLIGKSVDTLGQHIDADALNQLVGSLDSEGALDAMPLQLTRADGVGRQCLISAERMSIGAVAQVFCLIRDVTDQLQHDAAMRSAYEVLASELAGARREHAAAVAGRARAETHLHEFTSMIAHDLKAPVNAVHGFSGILRERLLAGHVEEALDFNDRISRVAERMNAMISALYRLAQVTKQPLQRRPVDMAQLARDTQLLLTASHPERTTEFRFAELPVAQADPDMAAQVWQNLLENAAKYSARVAKPMVAVDSFCDDRGTWYRVADNGAGFDMSTARLLFQPFQRMHTNKEFEGTGVGLSLVRRIIDHHGGEIRLRSAPGVGTVAEFTFDPVPV
ncbi:MAG: transporter substrate-binding domain-containing protein [Usitatibacteraceae bacterium]